MIGSLSYTVRPESGYPWQSTSIEYRGKPPIAVQAIAPRGQADEPRPAGYKKLVGREGWRIRSGDYRMIYEIDHSGEKITVLHIGHRRDVYS